MKVLNLFIKRSCFKMLKYLETLNKYFKKINRSKFGCVKLSAALVLICVALTIYYISRKPTIFSTRNKVQENVHSYLAKELQRFYFFDNKPEPFKGEKIVHLDLKGAPPKISYYKQLFPLLTNLGATGILIEYEDMFPYKGPFLSNVSALNAYTLDDIRLINQLAKSNHLKLIPLIQTFGHMEFILKLQRYKHYREVPAYPQAICPSHENNLNLIMDIVEQIVNMHEGLQMIHIGCDEVFHLGMCGKCTNRMNEENLTKNLLFLDHVKSIITMINKKYPNLRVLLWDDHLRSMTDIELASDILPTKYEPVVWSYSKDVYDELGPSLWDMYSKIFPKVWVASAFKGATGSSSIASDVSHYVQNHRSWLSVISEYKNRVQFEGIIITGWQRYDHFAVLCELLPVGIPSLAMSLRLLQGFQDSPLSPPTDVAKILQCGQPFALIGSAFGSPKCKFPGGAILENAIRLQQLKLEYETLTENDIMKGWLTDYNIKNIFSSISFVESVTDSIDKLKAELDQVDNDMVVAMCEVYDNYTVSEWRQTYVEPFKNQIRQLSDAKDTLLSKNIWPRRPFVSDIDL